MPLSSGSESGLLRTLSSFASAKASPRSRSIGTFLLSVLLMAGCDSPATVGIDAHASLSLAPANASLDEGHTLEFRVVSGTGSATVGAASSFSWQSSNPAVATVQNGVVTARGMGEATITASAPSGTFARGALRVTRSAEEIVLTRGDRQESVVGLPLKEELEVQVLSGAGNPVSGSTIQFAVTTGGGSLSTVVARTDENGMARTFWELGPIAGNQRVEAHPTGRPEVSALFTALARPDAPERIEVRPQGVTLQRGTQFVFDLVVEDRFGNVVGSAPVTWESEDPEIAQVDGEGRVVSLSGGETVIAATLTGGPGGFAAAFGDPAAAPGNGNGRALGRVRVEDTEDSGDPGASLSIISGDGQKGIVGELLPDALEVWVMDGSGAPIRNRDVTWTVRSGGGEVRNASSKTNGQGRASAGWVLGTSAGDGTLEVHVQSIGGVTFQATALAGPLAAVSLSPTSASVAVGAEQPFEILATDAHGNPLRPSSAPNWSAGDPSIATVSTSGRAKGKSVGSTQVIATVAGVEGIATLHVAGPESAVSSISLSPASSSLLTDESMELQATVTDQNGNELSMGDLDWVSSNSTIAKVNGNGKGAVVTAMSSGTATVTASIEGVTGAATFTVAAPPPPSTGPIPAFPGAEGYGAMALSTCNRGSPQIFKVTNRNDSGAGSFRHAVESASSAPSGNLKVVVFDVGGYIDASSKIRFEGDCLYIAGQTAPGSGVTLRGAGLEFHRDVRDVVVRYLRIRIGAGGGGDGILVRRGERFVFDHLSVSWAPSALLRFARTQISRSGPISHVTVQRSLLGESLTTQAAVGVQISGEPSEDEGGTQAGWRSNTYHSVHHNLFASNSHRNPNAQGVNTEVINNIVHNWNLDAGQSGRDAVVDFVNNFYQKGPMSREAEFPIGIDEKGITSSPYFQPSIHARGNLSLGGSRHSDQNTDPSADNWQGASRVVAWYRLRPDADPVPKFRRSAPLAQIAGAAPFPVMVQSAHAARSSVLGNVGANARLTCTGGWVSATDAIDQRLISEVQAGSGFSRRPGIDHESEVGGYPSVSSGTPCRDSNGDGIPDDWKAARGLDPMDNSVAGRIGAMGYSYLEHYLNGTNP